MVAREAVTLSAPLAGLVVPVLFGSAPPLEEGVAPVPVVAGVPPVVELPTALARNCSKVRFALGFTAKTMPALQWLDWVVISWSTAGIWGCTYATRVQ